MPCQSFLHRRHFKKSKNFKSVLVITRQPQVGFQVSDRILKALGMLFQMRPSNMESDRALSQRFEKTAKNQILENAPKNFTRLYECNHRSPSSDRCAQFKALWISFQQIQVVCFHHIGLKSSHPAKHQVPDGSVAPALPVRLLGPMMSDFGFQALNL